MCETIENEDQNGIAYTECKCNSLSATTLVDSFVNTVNVVAESNLEEIFTSEGLAYIFI